MPSASRIISGYPTWSPGLSAKPAESAVPMSGRISIGRGSRSRDGQQVMGFSITTNQAAIIALFRVLGMPTAATDQRTARHQHPQHLVTALADLAKAGEPVSRPGQ